MIIDGYNHCCHCYAQIVGEPDHNCGSCAYYVCDTCHEIDDGYCPIWDDDDLDYDDDWVEQDEDDTILAPLFEPDNDEFDDDGSEEN